MTLLCVAVLKKRSNGTREEALGQKSTTMHQRAAGLESWACESVWDDRCWDESVWANKKINSFRNDYISKLKRFIHPYFDRTLLANLMLFCSNVSPVLNSERTHFRRNLCFQPTACSLLLADGVLTASWAWDIYGVTGLSKGSGGPTEGSRAWSQTLSSGWAS